MSWRRLKIAHDRTHHVLDDGPAYAERFDEVLAFHAPGLAPVRRGQEAWHVRVDGAPAYARRFLRTFGFYEGLASVTTPEGWHHIDGDGQELSSARYAWCGNFQGGRCAVRRADGAYCHVDTRGRAVGNGAWRYAGDFRDGYAVVQAETGMSTHIDRDGRLLHGRWFLDLDVFHKGHARARDAAGFTHVDTLGRPIYARRFAQVEPFYNGQARVERFDGGLEVVDETGETICELRPAIALPPGLLASLEAAQGPRIALIRHADRVAGEGRLVPADAPLTAMGEARAALLRGAVSDATWARSSPLPRCLETARRAGLEPTPDALLGGPGPFVVDERLAAQTFAHHGTETVVRRHLRGETWGCMRSAQAGAHLLLEHIRSALLRTGSSGLAVSHDAVVMPVIAHVARENFEGVWLDPLDGLVLTPDGIWFSGRRFGWPA